MPLEAKPSKTWKQRFALLVLFLAAISCWFLYDGFIGYPKHNRIVAEYEKFVAEGRENDWANYAKQKGWHKKPGEAKTPGDILEQFVFAGISFVAALGTAAWLFISLNRKLISDGTTFYSASGKAVPFESIVEIDLKRWDSKGIAVIGYRQGTEKQKVILDDYKYEGGEQILEEIKAFKQSQLKSKTVANPAS